jgi:hypothetical protein
MNSLIDKLLPLLFGHKKMQNQESTHKSTLSETMLLGTIFALIVLVAITINSVLLVFLMSVFK